jgi:hypothetical protein
MPYFLKTENRLKQNLRFIVDCLFEKKYYKKDLFADRLLYIIEYNFVSVSS